MILLAVTTASCDSQPLAVTPITGPPVTGQPTRDDVRVVRVHGTPTGSFRTSPSADAAQVIRVALGDLVTISGARFTSSDPEDELKLEVEWGDGHRSANGCGPCRLEHLYAAGVYPLTATIHDRRLVDRGSATQAFTVIVQGPMDPAPPPAPVVQACHSISASFGTCPSGATQFCITAPAIDATSSAHAQAACDACFGAGVCFNSHLSDGFGNAAWTWVNPGLGGFFVYGHIRGTVWWPGELLDNRVNLFGRWAP